MVDQGFEVRAYVWLFLWYIFFVFDTVGEREAGSGRRVSGRSGGSVGEREVGRVGG